MTGKKQKVYIENNLFIGEGMGRKCYIHPEDKNLCIKIPNPRGKRSTQREIAYFKRLHKKDKSFEMIADYMGDVDTNLGEGNLYQLIRDYDGEISKNLEYYLELGNEIITSKMMDLIEELRQYLIEEYILISDLDMDNILIKKENENSYKLIVIDGIGDNNQIPLLEYIKPLGIKRSARKWEHFKKRIEKKFPLIASNIKAFVD